VRLIAHLGRKFAWASPQYIADNFTIPMLHAYASELAEMERHDQLPVAELKWLVASALGVKNTKPADWLSGFARDAVRPYAPAVAHALRKALRLGLVGPLGMGELDIPRLRASEGSD
jgi:hypothetical protein